jgi:hypothetical protein
MGSGRVFTGGGVLLSGGGTVRSLRGLLSRLGSVRPAEETRPDAGSPPKPEDGTVVTSKGLQRFLSYLGGRPAPILLDLGPVVGSNITFFGEQLNCKFVVEDLFADLERHLRDGVPEEVPAFLSKRFTLDEGTVDGVLLWDLYDYLDRPSAQALATALVRLLRTDGALLGFFGNASHAGSGCTRFIVLDDSHVRQRARASVVARHGSLQNRDIIKMFDGLRVSDAFQLQNGRREMLFRKGGCGRPII